MQYLYLSCLFLPQVVFNGVSGAKWGLEMRGNEHRSKLPGRPVRPPMAAKTALNEVVCGAMMLAYERAGKWNEALGVLERARALGIAPNTIMYNTAMSALAKSGRADAAEELFAEIPEPDAVSYETLIAAYGMAGLSEKAEAVYKAMTDVGHTPRDYAYCGLIAAFRSVS
jgi:pentatricopeptide repeat protein